MFVCICNSITSKDIEMSKRNGAKCERDVFQQCGSLPQCGECFSDIKRLLNHQLNALPNEHSNEYFDEPSSENHQPLDHF